MPSKLKNRRPAQFVFAALATLITVFSAFAGHEIRNARLTGTPFILNAAVTAEDNQFANLSSSAFTNYAVTDRIILAVKNSSAFSTLSPYHLRFTIKVDYIDVNSGAHTFNQNLDVEFDANCTNYIDKSVYTFTGGYQVSATVTGIVDIGTGNPVTTIPSNLYLEAEIDAERYYNFSLTAPATSTLYSILLDGTGGIENTDEIEIAWNKIVGAEEYDLEWMYVNDYNTTLAGSPLATSALSADFRNNATRVTVSNQYYRLPRVFERGYVIYRIRGVGRGGSAFDKRINGAWSTADGSNTLNNLPNKIAVAAHDDVKNWQFSASFAEQGKKKEVVNYFDGSLRNRQAVSKINTNAQAIVGETIYDHQGRGAVQVLPTPAFSPLIKYYPSFNLTGATGNTSYSKADFDVDANTSTCTIQNTSMSSTSGASKYYSPANPDQAGHQSFVPDAQGYPFTQVEYEPDNTGRIRRQSGVGIDHKLESNHETKYFYSKPHQEQLDRLFGSDVGYKSHYKRNSVIDANGQVSISYLDIQGRVIATSLAANAPSTTDALSSGSGSAANLTVDLLNKDASADVDDPEDDNELSVEGDALIFSTQLPVEVAGNVSFDYGLTAASFNTATRSCMPSNVCYDCVYDLEINVVDKCGASVSGFPVTQTIGHINPFDATCDGSPVTFSFTPDPITVSLAVGTYTVYKKLMINNAAYDFYLNNFIGQSACVNTEQSYINTFLAAVDTTGCGVTCAQCVTQLGTESAFISKGGTSTGYAKAIIDCNQPCKQLTPCEASYNMMLMDVSPGGQYALNSTDLLSVLNVSNSFSGTNRNWKNPSPDYQEEDGTDSYVTLHFDGTVYTPAVSNTGMIVTTNGILKIKPQYLQNVDDFAKIYWQQSWAKSLVTFHPEYCYFSWCDENKNIPSGASMSSEDFDALMLATTTLSGSNGAINLGLLNPFPSGCTTPNDPYFRTGGQGAGSQCTTMSGLLTAYTSNFTMWQMADILVNCGTTYGTLTDIQNCQAAANTQTITNSYDYITTDAEWEKFKYLYLSAKQKLQQQAANTYALTNNCFNGCVENQAFDPWTQGMINTSNYNSSEFFDAGQPCSNVTWKLYASKTKRFRNSNDIMGSLDGDAQTVLDNLKNKVDHELYIQTGQCPKARDLQFMLAKLASENYLATTRTLTLYPEFTQSLYNDVKTSSSFVAYSWTPSVSGATLNVGFGGSSTCTVTLTFASGTYSWTNYGTGGSQFTIKGFKQLSFTSVTSGVYSFTVVADVDHDNNASTATVEATLTGTTCIAIGNCTFTDECLPTQSALDLQTLWNTLVNQGGFPSTSGVDLEATPYAAVFVPTIKSYLGTGSGSNTWQWKNTTGNTYEIINAGSSNKLSITFNSSLPSGLTSFANIVPGTTAGTFTVNAMVGTTANVRTGSITLTRTGYSFPVGTCGPGAIQCAGSKYKVGTDLGALFNSIITTSPDGAGNIVLTYDPNLTPLLKSYISVNPMTDNYVLTNISVTDPLFTANLVTRIPSGDSTITLNTCQVSLEFLTSPTSTYKMSTVTGFSDLYADETNLTNGMAFSFTILAHFSDGTTRLLKGTTCFPLTNCHACSVADAANLVNNGDFKSACTTSPTEFSSDNTITCTTVTTNTTFCTVGSTTSGWGASGHGIASLSAITDHTGNGSNILFGQSPSSANRLWYKTVTVAAGVNYQFSAWVLNLKEVGNTSTFNQAIQLHVSTVANTLGPLIVSSGNIPNTGWQLLTGTFYATANASVELDIVINDPLGDGGAYVLDDISFRKQGCVAVTNANPPLSPLTTYVDPCVQHQKDIATQNGKDAYKNYITDIIAAFRADYVKKCIGSAVETFTETYPDKEYHFTLYYYDQAGNLVRTVPPNGVVLLASSTWATVKADRKALGTDPSHLRSVNTAHTYLTQYKYNTLNQLVQQITPDGGTSLFWYDALGRLVASQNSKQAAITSPGNAYSFTQYDALGRIIKVGELYSSTYNLSTMTRSAINTLLNASNYPDNFSNSGNSGKSQITLTTYDADPDYPNQINMRGRVASVKTDENNDGTYEYRTHYAYDAHGNVNKLTQIDPDLGTKVINYEYDLVSGNVTHVAYNQGSPDEFHHLYEYDADNRITNVYTGSAPITNNSLTPNVLADQDGKYFYYQHGPLSRTELGDKKVQGLDYAYTIQGWIKGVNSNTIDATLDIGKDGNNTTNINGFTARDQYGYSLGYFNGTAGDYKPINSSSADFIASISGSGLNTGSSELFNGNIRHMVTAIKQFTTQTQAMAYRYDQLNRIKTASMYNNLSSNVWGTGSASADYAETYAYDPNGNITALTRAGNSSGTAMDNFTYNYVSNTNKLNYISDAVASGNFTTDIDNQSANNYDYDQIGNLVKDTQEEIETIEWTVYGKVKKVIRTGTSTKPMLEFKYDGSGNRVQKKVTLDGADLVEITTYYVRDASGNVMATYERSYIPLTNNTNDLKLKEQFIYGSSRAGTYTPDKLLSCNCTMGSPVAGLYTRKLGQKNYELSNHLGNVLATVSDRRTPVDGNTDGTTDYFTACVTSAQDYTPFGTIMDGRSYNTSTTRYGFNGQEKVDEINGSSGTHYTAKFWEYDARLGRRWNRDPKPIADESEYAVNRNNPILNNDPDGDCPDCKVGAKASVSLTFGTKGQSRFSVGAGIGASARAGNFMGSADVSARLFGGGLGSKGLKDLQFDITASPSITFGSGTDASPSTLSTFHADNINSVENPFKNSLTVSSHNVLNFGGDNYSSNYQRVGAIGLKSGDVSFSTYNDFFPGLGDREDRRYTGGGELSIGLPGGNTATFGTNVFTGERNRDANNQPITYPMLGRNYYQMRAGTGNYNNGMTFLRVSNSQFTINASVSGAGQMYSQNAIHDNFPSGSIPRFSNTNKPISLQFGVGGGL